MATDSPSTTLPPYAQRAALNELRAAGRIEQLANLNLINDQQAGLAENRRSLAEHNRQTERAYRKMVDRQCGDATKDEADMPEDENITNNLGDTTHHHHYPVAKKKTDGGLLPLGIATGAGILTGGGGLALALMLTGAIGRGAAPAAATTTPASTVDDRAAKIELFYDDPVKGLIPLAGAADDKGATIPK